jgi:hypothetical protein
VRDFCQVTERSCFRIPGFAEIGWIAMQTLGVMASLQNSTAPSRN